MELQKIDPKKRKTPLPSKRKIVSMIKLYEKYVDEPIVSIEVSGYITSNKRRYWVNIHDNKVSIDYPDPEW